MSNQQPPLKLKQFCRVYNHDNGNNGGPSDSNTKFFVMLLCALILVIPLLGSCSMSGIIARHSFIVPKVRGTPDEVGIKYETIIIGNEKRSVMSWLVKAPERDTNYAVILFNGIGDGISSWVKVQKLLYENGISSLTFNYGDLKDTTLYPNDCNSTFEDVRSDAEQLMTIMEGKLPKGTMFVCLGFSMGCGVLTGFMIALTPRAFAQLFCAHSFLQ